MSVKSLSLFAFGACEFLRSLAPKVLSNDSSLSVVCERISSLFSQLLLSENPLSQEMGLETFAFFAFVTKYEQIVPETVATHHRLQNDISNFLDGNPIVNCDTTLEDFQKSLAYKFEHKCEIAIKMCTTRVHENPECNPPKKLKVSHEDTEHSSQTLEQRAEWKSENESNLPLHELGNSVQTLEENIEDNISKGQDISFEELENALCRVEEGINLVQNYVSLRPLNIQLLTRIGNIKEICSKIVYHRI